VSRLAGTTAPNVIARAADLDPHDRTGSDAYSHVDDRYGCIKTMLVG
jgi:hypothetical protein